MTTTEDVDDGGIATAEVDDAPGPRPGDRLRRVAGPVAVAAAAVFALATVAVALLRTEPLTLADDARQAAVEVAATVTGEGDLGEVTTAAFDRQLADGRIDATPLGELAGASADEPVVLRVDDREARVLVVLRDEQRHRLELILVRDDDRWRLDRFERY